MEKRKAVIAAMCESCGAVLLEYAPDTKTPGRASVPHTCEDEAGFEDECLVDLPGVHVVSKVAVVEDPKPVPPGA